MTGSTEITVRQAVEDPFALDVRRVLDQTAAIQRLMKAVMIPGHHYGVIPGTEKPTLLQPGADKLAMLFRLRPKYRVIETHRPDFIRVRSRCVLIHIPTGEVVGEGMGAANSREERYLNQSMVRTCPKCQKPTIFRSKDEGKGWFCWAKKGGCGQQYLAHDPRLADQDLTVVGDKVLNLDNTILKIANKRSKSAAILTSTGASDIFNQDLDDLEEASGAVDEDAAARNGTTAGTNSPNGNGNGNGAGGGGNGDAQRAHPKKLVELNQALQGKVPPEERLAWVCDQLQEKLEELGQLTPDECARLTEKAKNLTGGGR